MKTMTIKKTDNGNYVTCVHGITGTQSESNTVHVFNENFEYLKTIGANPRFSFIAYCKQICNVGGIDYANINKVQEALQGAIENSVTGYTTYSRIKKGSFQNLLSPLG